MKTYLPRKRAESQIIENIKNLCRLCLNECVNGLPIYPDSECAAQPILATKIMMCVGIEVVPKSKELSNLICLHCMEEINKNYAYRKVCEIAYQRIKLHLQAEQLIRYKHRPHEIEMISKESNKDSEINEQSLDKENNTQDIDITPEKVIDKQLIEPVHTLLDPDKQQYITISDSIEPNDSTYLDHYTGKLQIVEIQQDYGQNQELQSIENQITEPILETNDFNRDNLNSPKNTSHANVNINQDGKSEENKVIIENNILIPNMYNVSKSVMLSDYFQQVTSEAPSQISDDNLNPIYFVKAKEREDSNVMECTENTNIASTNNINNTSDMNNQILTIDISNEQVVNGNSTSEIMSQHIVSRLKGSGIIKMEGVAIAQCDIGFMHLETPDGNIVTMEIVEEDSHREFKTRKRKKKQAQAHTCSQCGLVVKSRSSLVRHALRHSGERKFACDKCSRTFRQRGTLNRHRTLHQEVRPFPCPSCSMSFTQRGALASHARAHASSEHRAIHACEHCDAAYAHASGLVRHVKRVHKGEKPQCTKCFRTLSDQCSLKRHLESCTGNQQCPNCSKTVTCSIKRHLKDCRMVKCAGCFKMFDDKGSLKGHNTRRECNIAPRPNASDSV